MVGAPKPAHFRVIISGGGVAGLTLANSLQHAGIDYVLLEGRDQIAPQVGASIGLFANGNRILDQLGCYDEIQKESGPIGISGSRYDNGEMFSEADGVALMERRFHYETCFLDRQIVLRVLYDRIKDKSKILLSKRVSKIDHNTDGVVVHCEDGSSFAGDVVVGCDGVYSTVRQQMWDIAAQQDPGYISPADESALSAEYQCLFGISSATPGLVETRFDVNYSKDFSTMTIVGKKGRVFWFMFKRLDKVYKAPNIPKYSRKEAEDFADRIKDFPLTKELTFGDLWKNRLSYTLVATEEAKFSRWTWGRIACAGDNVHKMTPNMGAGGNAAMESAVALANVLYDLAQKSKGTPSLELIKKSLAAYQHGREHRVNAIMDAANGLTRIHALRSLKDKLMAFWIIPTAGDTLIDLTCDMLVGAVKLDYMPTPPRSFIGTMPFNPEVGLGKEESKLFRALKALPFAGLSLLGVYFMLGVCIPGLVERATELVEAGKIESLIGKPGTVIIPETFYGIPYLDHLWRGVTACFGVYQFIDPIGHWQGFTFLVDLGVIYAIWLIESARRSNVLTLAMVPLLFGWYMQLFGGGVLIHWWCFFHYIQSPVSSFRALDMRLTDLSYSASVLPTMLLCHYLPIFGSWLNFLEPQTRHSWIWIWQMYALWCTITQFVLKKTAMPDTVQKDRIQNPTRDLGVIRFTIGSLSAVSAAVWLHTLYAAPFSALTLFIPDIASATTGDDWTRAFLQFDWLLVFTSILLWLCYLYADMKKAGMMDASWFSIFTKGVLSFAALGPGATLGLGWLWREEILATRKHKDASGREVPYAKS